MLNKIIPIFVSLVLVMITSCQKKDSEKSPTKNKTQLLTERPWKLISYGLDNNSDNYIDPLENEIRDCEKDNTYTFSSNRTGIVSENSQICPGNDVINTFNWSFFNDESGLDFEFGFLLISKLSADSMILREDYNGPGKLILSYTH